MEETEFIPSEKEHGNYLTLAQYDLIMSFLNTRIKPSRQQLKNAQLFLNLNGVPGKTTFYRFNSIVRRVCLRLWDGALLLKTNSKVILPCSRFVEVIKAAHENSGGKHISMTRTVAKLAEKYAMGRRQYGINEDLVRKVVRSCPDCQKADKSFKANTDGLSVMKNFVSGTSKRGRKVASHNQPIQPRPPSLGSASPASTTPTKPGPGTAVNASLPASLIKMLQSGTCTLIPINPTTKQVPTSSGSLTNLCMDSLMRPLSFSSPQGDMVQSVGLKLSADKHSAVQPPASDGYSNVKGRVAPKPILPKPTCDNAIKGTPSVTATESLVKDHMMFNMPGTGKLVESVDNNNNNNNPRKVLSETSDHIIVDNLQQELTPAMRIQPDTAGTALHNETDHLQVTSLLGSSSIPMMSSSTATEGVHNLLSDRASTNRITSATSSSISPPSTRTSTNSTGRQMCEEQTKQTQEEQQVMDVEEDGNLDNQHDEGSEEAMFVDVAPSAVRGNRLRLRLESMPLNYSHLWHNREELEKELVPFMRLTGCIQDLRLDMMRASAGDAQSADTLKKKISVLEQMIRGQKAYTLNAGKGAGILGM